MLHQYNAQRFRRRVIRNKVVHVGTIEVGQIFYLQDGVRPFGRDCHAPTVCRNPWIVESWHNRVMGAAVKIDGKYQDRIMAGGHLATVRSLRTGRREVVADWILRWHDDNGFEKIA